MEQNHTGRSGRVIDLGTVSEPLVFADLHIHSRYSRATSPQMEIQTLYYWGKRKGIGLLGTGDFTHPEYYQALTRELEADATGFYRVRGQADDVRFVPATEIANIYKQNGKTRRIHTLVIARSLEVVQEINRALASRGNVAADGRPIFGFSVKHLARLLREIDPETLVIPAHIWTPWFSVLGEKSGFDSLAEAFEEELEMVAAVETGLSSDPEMNWRLSQLDPYTIISNSDAHSPAKLARECNAFQGPLTWQSLRESLRNKNHSRLLFTIEFFPEEGKYHWPGHHVCGPAIAPEEYLQLKGQCPVCRKPLTNGVASRVEALADRPAGYVPAQAPPGIHLVPLDEILGEAFGKGTATKIVQSVWEQLVAACGNELQLLLFTPEEKLLELAGAQVTEAVMRMRQGRVEVQPGYDGIYGKVKIFGKTKSQPESSEQLLLPC